MLTIKKFSIRQFVYNLFANDFLPIFFLLLIIFAFFFRLFYPSLSIFVTPDFGLSDAVHGYYPLKHLLSESLKNNQILLWSKDIGGGQPIFADGQIGTFVVTNLLFFRLFPTFLAINFTYISIFIMIALGAYFFAREINLNRSTSFFASIAYTFSGFHITHIKHLSLLQSISFFPLELFLLERLLLTKKKRYFFLFSIVLSQQIFSGHQQMSVYSGIVLFLYFIMRIITEKRLVNFKLKANRTLTSQFFMSFVLALTLSAVLIVPSLELIKYSARRNGVSVLSNFPFPPKHLLTFISPYFYGNPQQGTYPMYGKDWGIFWENTGYVGIIPILLLFFLVFLKKKKDTRILIFCCLLMVSILLILGKYSPLYFIFSFPPLSLFRVPSRFLFSSDFALAILAAISLDNIIVKIKSVNSILLIVGIISIIQLVDISYYFYNFNPIGKVNDWFQQSDTVSYLKKHLSSNDRFVTFEGFPANGWDNIFQTEGWMHPEEYLQFQTLLPGRINIMYGLNKYNGLTALPTSRTSSIQNIMFRGVEEKPDKERYISETARKIINMNSVKYLLVDKPFHSQQYIPEKNFTKSTIYLNTQSIARAHMSFNAETIRTFEDFLAKIQSSFDPGKTTLLEQGINFPIINPLSNTHSPQSTITWIRDENQITEVNVKTEEKGLFVLADSYYPGWKAYVDGKETKIYPANLNQRAIVVEKGSHTVKFSYEPLSFKIGAIISIISHIVIIGLMVFPWIAATARKSFDNRKLFFHR